MSKTDNMEVIGRAMMAAWKRIKTSQSRMWGDWMSVGEGLMEGRRWAMEQAQTNKPEGKGYILAYSEWLKRYKVDDMDKSDRAKLLQLMEDRPGVEEWRATLTDHERRSFNYPTVVWSKWTAATKVKKPKVKKPGGAKERKALDQLQGRVTELEEEVETAQSFRSLLERILSEAGDMLPPPLRADIELVLA